MTYRAPYFVVADPFRYHEGAYNTLHKHCRNNERCIGPGCVRSTGKTARNRRPSKGNH